MVGSAGGNDPSGTHRQSPKGAGGVNTQSLCVAVDDADAHCARARAAGAKIVVEPTTKDYGGDYWADRTYEAWIRRDTTGGSCNACAIRSPGRGGSLR